MIRIPEEVHFIIQKLNENCFAGHIVGGCVRDSIMGREPKDWDITTNALPNQIQNIFDKTVDTGSKHGTITVLVNKKAFEVTTYRIDGEYKDFRRPTSVTFTNDLIKDLSRRDFTINAMAYNKINGFIDPFGGMDDIKNFKIKAVGEPDHRFNEDALRMLRALRFSIQLNFEIESDTYDSLIKNRELIKFVSIERIREEFLKILQSEFVERLGQIFESNIFLHVNTKLNDYLLENKDYITENIKHFQMDNELLFSFLFSKMTPNDIRAMLKFFKLDNITIKNVDVISNNINKKLHADNIYEIRKNLAVIGKKLLDKIIYIKSVLQLQSQNDLETIKNHIEHILKNKDCLSIKDLKINGNDIMKYNVVGKKIGEALNYLFDIVLKEPSANTADRLHQELENYLLKAK